MSRIHFIGGEKGGVGKSVVARLLAQYWTDNERSWKGFDTDRSHGALLRYYPEYARPVELTRLPDLDAIMETAIESDSPLLVDLAAQSHAAIQAWIDDGGVFDLADDADVKLTFWHVMDDGKDSVQLLERLLQAYGQQADYILVLNRGRGEDFRMLENSQAKLDALQSGAQIMELRALHKPTMQRIDEFDKSFWGAVNNTDAAQGPCLGLMERQRVKTWLRNAYAEFARMAI